MQDQVLQGPPTTLRSSSQALVEGFEDLAEGLEEVLLEVQEELDSDLAARPQVDDPTAAPEALQEDLAEGLEEVHTNSPKHHSEDLHDHALLPKALARKRQGYERPSMLLMVTMAAFWLKVISRIKVCYSQAASQI